MSNRTVSRRARKPVLASITAFLLAVMVLSIHPSLIYSAAPTNAAASGDSSWNPMVNCTPTVVTIEQILGNQSNPLRGASENGSIFNPGTSSPLGPSNTPSWLAASSSTPPGWVSPGPSCTITNAQGQVVSAFVQIDGVQRSYRSETNYNSMFMPINGGTSYQTGPQSDSTFSILTPGYGSCSSTNTTGCMHSLVAEIDHDWKAAGYCGPNTACDNNTLVSETAAYKSLIDVQGFLFWNPATSNSSDHNYSGWELHPVTAWRISNISSDYTLSAHPSLLPVAVGQSAQTRISVDTFNLFTGNVSFTATISASSNASGPTPTAVVAPSAVYIQPGRTGSSTLTVTATSSTTGNYTIMVSGSNGTISRMVDVGVYVTDFGIVANPSSLSLTIGSSSQSSLSLLNINGFSGNVSLATQVNPVSTTAGLSLFEPTASTSASTVALSPGRSQTVTLTVSTSLLTTPGTYAVTVTAVGDGVSHTMTITVTVTIAGLGIGGVV